MTRAAITQLSELSYDICFWVDPTMHQWLEDCNLEYTMITHGAPPYCWILEFKDYGDSALFKMAWIQ